MSSWPLVLAVGTLLIAGIPASQSEKKAWIDPALETTGSHTVSAIVQVEDGPGPDTLDRLQRYGEVAYTYEVIDAVHLLLPANRVPLLAQDPAVWRIQADEDLAWHLDTSRPSVKVGPPVWSKGIQGMGSTVAVVDTGIDTSHPGLGGKVRTAVVYTGEGTGPVQAPTGTDTDGHGTHVAGIVAGTGDGSQLLRTGDRRYAGMAVGSDLVALDISQSFSTSTAIKAFDWVHQNHEAYDITVVQNSWGRKNTDKPFDPDDAAVRASNALVRDDDLLLVFSAANAGPDPSTLSMEAMNPNVLTVGAVDDAGRVAEFSSRGPVIQQDGTQAPWLKPDVAAPGVAIKSAASKGNALDGLYKELSGTSQAAPHVAGIASMIRAANPELGPLEIMEVFRRSAVDVGAPGPDTRTGHGVVEGAGALQLALAAEDGQLTVPKEERYNASGTLVLGDALTATSMLTGNLSGETGVEAGRAAGQLPVKQGATQLNFTFTWTSSTPAPQPDLRITLTPPGQDPLAVPASGGEASRSITDPAPGPWRWEAQGADPMATGTADYEMASTVLVPQALSLTGDFGGSGGYFNSPLDQARAAAERFAENLGPGAYALVAGWLLAVLLVATVKRVT